jgi:hypothetical protein
MVSLVSVKLPPIQAIIPVVEGCRASYQSRYSRVSFRPTDETDMTTENRWLTRLDVAKALGVTTRHSFITEPFGEIERQFELGEMSGTIHIAGLPVRWQRHGRSHYVSPSSMKAFEAQLALKPRAGNDYLSKEALALELGVTHTHAVVRQTWQRIREQTNDGRESGVVEIHGQRIEWQIFYSDRNVKLPFVSRGSLDAVRAALAAEPQKATGDELSLSRLGAMLSTHLQNPMMRQITLALDGEIAAGKTEGVTRIGNVNVPWRMAKAVWGGSSKHGGLSPHVHISAVEPLALALKGDTPFEVTSNDGLLDIGVEDVREIALNVVGADSDDPAIIYAKAIETAGGNLFFEVGGCPHLMLFDGQVFRAFDEDGDVVWHKSSVMQGQGGITHIKQAESGYSFDHALNLVANDPVTRWDVSTALGVTSRHSLVTAVFGCIDDDIKNGHTHGSLRIGSTIFPWVKGKMPHGGSYAPLLPSSAIPALQKLAANRPMATDDYLSREGLMEELEGKANRSLVFRLWATIGNQAERGPDRGTLVVDGHPVPWRYLYSSSGSRFPYVSRTTVPALKHIMTLDTSEVSIEAVRSPVFDMLDDEPRMPGSPSAEIEGEDISRVYLSQADGSSGDREAVRTRNGNLVIVGTGSIRIATPEGVLFEQLGHSWKRDDNAEVELINNRSAALAFRP